MRGDRGWPFVRPLSGRAERNRQVGRSCRGSIFGGRLEEFRGRSVLIASTDQLTAALALLELDGMARRLILYPPDLPWEQRVSSRPGRKWMRSFPIIRLGKSMGDGLARVSSAARSSKPPPAIGPRSIRPNGSSSLPAQRDGRRWSSHIGESDRSNPAVAVASTPIVWSTFYDIRRYGGLQVLLRAILGRASLVLSGAGETTADFLRRCGRTR